MRFVVHGGHPAWGDISGSANRTTGVFKLVEGDVQFVVQPPLSPSPNDARDDIYEEERDEKSQPSRNADNYSMGLDKAGSLASNL